MPVFPPTLPPLESARDFSGSAASNVIRTSMDAGPAKVRKRSTAAPEPQRMGSSHYKREDLVALLDFFNNTLKSGSLSFEMTNPVTQLTREYRFVNPLQYQSLGAGVFSVSAELELLP